MLSQRWGRLRTEDIFEVLETCRSDDGRGDLRLGQDPRRRDLCHAHALLLCELLDSATRTISASSPTLEKWKTQHAFRGGQEGMGYHRPRGTCKTYVEVQGSKKDPPEVDSPVCLLPDGLDIQRTGEQPTPKRGPWDRAYAELLRNT